MLLLVGLPELHVHISGGDLSALPAASQGLRRWQRHAGSWRFAGGLHGLLSPWPAPYVPPKYRRRSRALASRGELSTEGGRVRVVVGYGHDPQCR